MHSRVVVEDCSILDASFITVMVIPYVGLPELQILDTRRTKAMHNISGSVSSCRSENENKVNSKTTSTSKLFSHSSWFNGMITKRNQIWQVYFCY